MRVYQYLLQNHQSSVEFYVATNSAEDAAKLFDITNEEFLTNGTVASDKEVRTQAIAQPGCVFYRNGGSDSALKALPAGETVLTVRLKYTLKEMAAA